MCCTMYSTQSFSAAHKNAAAAAAAMTPNSAAIHCPGIAVGIAAPVERAVVEARAAITFLTMLNWSLTCCSLKALALLGSAVYQFGLEKKVVVSSAMVTAAGML